MRRPKVIRVVDTFYPVKGGSVTHIIELSKHIDKFLDSQIIIAPKYNSAQEYEFDLTFGIPIIRVKTVKLKLLRRMLFPVVPIILLDYSIKVARLIKQKERNEDNMIIHAHGELLGLFIILFKRLFKIRFPVVIMQHGNPKERSVRSRISLKIAHFGLKYLKPEYYLILDDGTDIEEYIEWLRKSRIRYRVVYHGIDSDFFSPTINKNIKTDEHKKFKVLSNHRLIPVKRIDLAIKGFIKFMEILEYPENVEMIIAGDGPLREKLENMINHSKLSSKIKMTGELPISQIRDVILDSSVVVGTSLESNLNRAIQEAMSCEKPVVVFDSGGTSKLIIHTKNGILVPAGNIEKFAEGIRILYENPKCMKKIGINARKTIIKHRSWKARIATELEVYSVLMGQHKF